MTLRRPNFDSYYNPPDFEAADYPCDVCGKPTDSCICHQCLTCGEYGNPACYEAAPDGHGLIRTPEQEASFAAFCKARDDEIAAENAYYDGLAEAEEEARMLADEYWAEVEEANRKQEEYWESIINPDRV